MNFEKRTGDTLYSRARGELEALALSGAFDESMPLPPEHELAERLGVSRGTLRQAMGALEREGLVRRQPGRGTFVDTSSRVRRLVFERLAEVARPDSRFHLELSSFVPDFVGSESATARVCSLAEYATASVVLTTSDESLRLIRTAALLDGKRLLVGSHELKRGLFYLDGSTVPPEAAKLAATLDGAEIMGRPVSFAELAGFDEVDLVVTGAAAVTRGGTYFGGGHGCFDLLWGLMAELVLVCEETPVAVVVHDCQLIELDPPRTERDPEVDLVATPSELVRFARAGKAKGLPPGRLASLRHDERPYFAQLPTEHRLLQAAEGWPPVTPAPGAP